MRVWVTAVAIALMLAGCAEETPEPIEEDFTLEEDLEATETTGVIRGVVVDSAIVPIVGATITISTTGQSTATNEDGAFGFDGLEPGTYFFEVTKLGYAPVQQSADVEAGVAQPPVVRVQMLPDESFVDPYSEMFQYDGFYQCGTSVVVVCAAPGILLGFFGQPDPTDPDAPRSQFGRSIPIDPVSGSYNTDEVFGEIQIPLVSPSMDVPFVNLLEAKGAIRYVDNSLTGGDITWTAGGRWKPVEDFAIRGNFTRSIRAPAITELFNPNSAIFTTADDPCDARFINAGPNPAQRAANCAADGLPANFTSNIVDFTTRGSLSGNTELENETADSWTIGAVFTPTFAPGLTLSVDWVDIALEGAIQSVDAEGTLEACYDANDFPNSACDRIDRDGAGQVEGRQGDGVTHGAQPRGWRDISPRDCAPPVLWACRMRVSPPPFPP